MDLPTIIDPAYKALCNELAQDIDNRSISLATGGARDMETYREQVGYIQALTNVINRCAELERVRYGKRPGDKDE
jgi:hypothetical protein